MSRGPGRIERAIRALFDAHPDEAFVTDELCEHCYPEVRPIEKKHQVAVLRAAWNVLKTDPDWTARRMWGDQGMRWKFYNRDSIASVGGGVRPHRRQPAGHTWEWVGGGRGGGRMRRKVSPETARKRREAVTQRLEQSMPGFAARGAALGDRIRRMQREHDEREVAEHRLVRDADPDRREVLLTAFRQIMLDYDATRLWNSGVWPAWLTKPDIWLKRYQARAGMVQETHTETIIMPPAAEAARLAAHLRALAKANDPDAQRAGILAVADALDAIAAPPALVER